MTEELGLDEIVESLESNSERIRSFGVSEIQVFGSYVRGEQGEDSDIDFLVEFEEGRGLFNDFIGLKRFLNDLFEPDVDVVKKDKVREELRDEILRGDYVGVKI